MENKMALVLFADVPGLDVITTKKDWSV